MVMDISINTNLAFDHYIQLSYTYYLIPTSGTKILTSVDLNRAFHTVDTKLLLEKLAHLGLKIWN